jgi:hypothetical protein
MEQRSDPSYAQVGTLLKDITTGYYSDVPRAGRNADAQVELVAIHARRCAGYKEEIRPD